MFLHKWQNLTCTDRGTVHRRTGRVHGREPKMGNVYVPPWASPLADDSTFGMENVLSEGPANIKLDGK
jgi:hypothetical protein